MAEVGRVEKTRYLLAYVQEMAYRRCIVVQRDCGGSSHTLARTDFHGKIGKLRQRHREDMEDQLRTLKLVVNDFGAVK